MEAAVSEPVERKRLLVEGLVGPYRGMYHGSASFHAAIELLADMLPLMVDGLAADAARREDHHQEVVARLMARPLDPEAVAALLTHHLSCEHRSPTTG